MQTVIERTLKNFSSSEQIKVIRPVTGGDINEAFYVETQEAQYFVKLNRNKDLTFFEFEANGLREIAKTNTIRVPTVYHLLEDETTHIPMLWLEWVEGTKTKKTDDELGTQLASMHLSAGEKYGLQGVSYIGRLKQNNEWCTDWLTYYRDFRLLQQVKMGERLGFITGRRLKQLMELLERLDEWIPKKPVVSLLHGDLWGGNWIVGEGGHPYLIDPSILYGDHEMELAFTELFGGFSSRFYQAYAEVFPLSAEYEERKGLYQLYYLLVHLNMFGESYARSVDRILQKYV